MPISRTPIIDDDGTGTTGTVIDNAWKQELYNQIDGAAGNVPAPTWAAFTPGWFSTGAQPAVGNGSIVGTFATVAGLTSFEILLTIGSTTNLGTGAWTWGSPTAMVLPGANRAMLIISGRAYDVSTGISYAIAGGMPYNTVSFGTFAASGSLSGVLPFAFAVGDLVQLAGSYRSA